MFGWKGYEQVIEQQIETGKFLKAQLLKTDWEIFNQTQLPIVCFCKDYFKGNPDAALQLSNRIIESGKAWISTYNVNGLNMLRACITNYATDENDIKQFSKIVNKFAKNY